MGGSGTGCHWAAVRRFTVEECFTLDLNWLMRDGYFDAGNHSNFPLYWYRASDNKQIASVSIELDLIRRHMGLSYSIGESKQVYTVRLSTSQLPWGGTRWWGHCPLIAQGKLCGARVSKLYKPPNCVYFGCRRCHRLSYQSRQDSRRVAGGWGLPSTGMMLSDSNFQILLNQRRQQKLRVLRHEDRREQRRKRRKARGWK